MTTAVDSFRFGFRGCLWGICYSDVSFCPGFSGGGSSVRERSLGGGCRKLQETGEDTLWGRPPHHRLHLLPGILHQTLQAPAYGQHLETLSQSAEGAWPYVCVNV